MSELPAKDMESVLVAFSLKNISALAEWYIFVDDTDEETWSLFAKATSADHFYWIGTQVKVNHCFDVFEKILFTTCFYF